jgi:hypothetical protein
MPENTPISKPLSKRGGRRPGSGRKKKALTELRAELVSEADRLIVEDLTALTRELLRLAHGGYERVEERYEPAGLVLVDGLVKGADGEPLRDDKGKAVTAKVPAFPGKAPDELVLISRTVSTADADRAAIQYAMDRVLGRAKMAVEVTGKDGGPVQHALVDLSSLPPDDLIRLADIAGRVASDRPEGTEGGG